jgi:hypothetical protein
LEVAPVNGQCIADQKPIEPEALQAHFLSILPRIKTHAQIRFGFLRCPGKREDAIAEVVAVAWKWFLRLIEQGKDVNEFVMVLADYAVRHVRSGRKLCGQEKAKDVLSPRAQRLKGFRVERLPSSILRNHNALYSDPHSQELIDAFEERLKDNTQSPVPGVCPANPVGARSGAATRWDTDRNEEERRAVRK